MLDEEQVTDGRGSAEAGTALEELDRTAGERRGIGGRAESVLAGLVVVAGLALTLYVADALLQRMPHVQDSVAYLFQAKIFALGRLWVPTPPHPQFFQHEFVVMTRDGRWFGKYPPGWPVLLALGVLAGAPWVIDPICAALSLFLLYRIGRDVYGARVGLLAAILGLSAPFFIFLSGSMMAHSSGLLFTLLTVWGFWHAHRSERPLWPAIGTGLAFGMTFLIRPYTALLVVAPFAVYALLAIARRPGEGLRRYLPAGLAAVPLVAAFFVDNKLYTGNFLYPPQQLWWAFDQVGFGPNHGPFGFTPLDGLNNTSRNLSQLLEHGFGWPLFLTLSLVLVPFLIGRARTWDWLFLLGFLAVVVGYACWWADGIMYGPRFYYEGFGFLVLLTARGVDIGLGLADAVFARIAGKVGAPRIAPAALAVVVAGLIGFNLAFYLPGQWTLYHGYNYVNRGKLDVIAAAGIHHAVVFADVGPWYAWWEYGMVFSANDPLLQGDVIYARDLGDAADRLLFAQFPGRSFYRLDGTTVTPIPGAPHP